VLLIVLRNFWSLLTISLGFEKGKVSRAVYSTPCTVDYILKMVTANLCSSDLSSASDKVNHHGLSLKLMKRHIPNELLIVVENWLSSCDACVKWKEVWSVCFEVNFGVRPGSLLSPYLFRDVANLNDCYKRSYTDDILLIAVTIGPRVSFKSV